MTPSDQTSANAPFTATDQGQYPPPRAFSQGTGVLLQTVGMALFLSSCCLCSLAGTWDTLLSRPEVLERLAANQPLGVPIHALLRQPAHAGVMLMVMFTTVGGLAMAAFGLGLQAQRRRSAWGALGTVLALLAILAVAGVAIWFGRAHWVIRLWHAVLTGAVAVLAGFVWAALQEMRAHPPPIGIDVLGPDAKIPYSVYHDDPPEMRLAKELAQRRARLEAEKEELEKIERDLRNT